MKRKRPAASIERQSRTAADALLHPVDWAVASNAVDDVLREVNARLRRRRRVRASGAAVVALLLATIVWHRPGVREVVSERSAAVVVTVPERQVLPDGTIVELNEGAEIRVNFSKAVRRVVLTKGEAHFQVATRAVPFAVAARGVEVRAVGTAFSVQLGRTEVEVVVTEGVVDVAQLPPTRAASASDPISPGIDSPGFIPARVKAGNRVRIPAEPLAVAAAPAVMPMAPVDLAARLAWRAPRLEFSRTPLDQALALMKQHAAPGNEVNVTFADRALGRVEISGVLRADNLETLLRLVEEEHGIRTEHVSPTEIRLRK